MQQQKLYKQVTNIRKQLVHNLAFLHYFYNNITTQYQTQQFYKQNNTNIHNSTKLYTTLQNNNYQFDTTPSKLYTTFTQLSHNSSKLYTNTQLCNTIHNYITCTELLQDFTQLHKILQHFTKLYKTLHKTLHNSTTLHKTLQISTFFFRKNYTVNLHNFTLRYNTLQIATKLY